MSAAPLWTAAEARAATGGRNTSDWLATGVSIDSRSVVRNDLFVALKGPSFDGHDFVAQAFESGAAAGLVSRTPSRLPDKAPLLYVDDTLAALGALARAARRRTSARICAVTGSAGKTGTKEALRHVLSAQGAVAASVASFNNHWGVPLSVARMPARTDYGVFEIGMNHPGEISPLVQIVRPHVAVITTVDRAHTEFFDSVEAIADAKAEIFDGVVHGGTAVLNRDNPHFDRLAQAAGARGIENIVAFGAHAAADARVIDCVMEDRASNVSAVICGQRIEYIIGVPGRHWVANSLAVLAAVHALGADVAAAARALADLAPLDGRGRIHEAGPDGARFVVIDESYNANPASMRSAIETLAGMSPGPGGRRIAVLGEMRELGPDSPTRHAELAGVLEEQGIDLVHAAGEMRLAHQRLPERMRGITGDSGEDIREAVAAGVRSGDVVMVKGSNASRMGVVVAALLGAAGDKTG